LIPPRLRINTRAVRDLQRIFRGETAFHPPCPRESSVMIF